MTLDESEGDGRLAEYRALYPILKNARIAEAILLQSDEFEKQLRGRAKNLGIGGLAKAIATFHTSLIELGTGARYLTGIDGTDLQKYLDFATELNGYLQRRREAERTIESVPAHFKDLNNLQRRVAQLETQLVMEGVGKEETADLETLYNAIFRFGEPTEKIQEALTKKWIVPFSKYQRESGLLKATLVGTFLPQESDVPCAPRLDCLSREKIRIEIPARIENWEVKIDNPQFAKLGEMLRPREESSWDIFVDFPKGNGKSLPLKIYVLNPKRIMSRLYDDYQNSRAVIQCNAFTGGGPYDYPDKKRIVKSLSAVIDWLDKESPPEKTQV